MNSRFPKVQIREVIQLQNDSNKSLKSSQYQSSGRLPVVDQSSQLICGYTDDEAKTYGKDLPVVVFGDHTLHVKYIDFPFVVGADGTQVIVPKNSGWSVKYLYYLLDRAAQLIGAEGYKRHLSIVKEFWSEFTETESEQQKIATILSSVDDVIEKTRAQIDKLKDLKTGMMQELLTQGIGHTEFKDSPVGRIPASWNVFPINSVCSAITDCVNKTAPVVSYVTPYKMIRTTNVRDGEIDTENVRYVTEDTFNKWSRRVELQSGDIVFTREAPVGECGMIHDPRGLFMGQRTVMYRANPATLDSSFLLYTMQSEYFQAQIEDLSGGSTTPHLRVPDCSKMLVKVPPMQEQMMIGRSIGGIDDVIKANERRLSRVQALKKALMQDLLTGEVRVNIQEKESEVA